MSVVDASKKKVKGESECERNKKSCSQDFSRSFNYSQQQKRFGNQSILSPFSLKYNYRVGGLRGTRCGLLQRHVQVHGLGRGRGRFRVMRETCNATLEYVQYSIFPGVEEDRDG